MNNTYLKNRRVLSLDIFRALTMLLMIFVNDLSNVSNIPNWLEHASITEDRLGFADIIFPIFLFIVGLSIPLAIQQKLKQGQSYKAISWHIITRTSALLLMGFFHVNLENYSSAALIPEPMFEILVTLSFFLIWLDYPSAMNKYKKYACIGTGISILLLMAILFKGGTPNQPTGLSESWWGILGVIGWSYLFSSVAFLVFKGSLKAMLYTLIALLSLNILMHLWSIDADLWVIYDGSYPALTTAGVIVSLWYGYQTGVKNDVNKQGVYSMLSGFLIIICGLIIRGQTNGISKLRSTPAWVLLCMGIGIIGFEIIRYVVDIKGKQNWFEIIKPAGTSTLTSYLLPYFLYSIYTLINFNYPPFLNSGIGGFFRSVMVALIIVMITGFLEKKRIRLRI